jgi:hypothetical protein
LDRTGSVATMLCSSISSISICSNSVFVSVFTFFVLSYLFLIGASLISAPHLDKRKQLADSITISPFFFNARCGPLSR